MKKYLRNEATLFLLDYEFDIGIEQLMKLSHVVISCKDQQEIQKFYTTCFGFKRSRAIDLGDSKIVFLKNEDVHLELFQADEDRPLPRAVGDGPHYPEVRRVAFRADDVDEISRAMVKDAEVTLGPLQLGDFIKGWKTVWLKDPGGNIVETSQGYSDADSYTETVIPVASGD